MNKVYFGSMKRWGLLLLMMVIYRSVTAQDGYKMSFYDKLMETNNNLPYARRHFKAAKLMRFYKPELRKRANMSIAYIELKDGDSLKAERRLKRILGKRLAKKIEKAQFGKISRKEKEQWNEYYASGKLVNILINKGQFDLAFNYLKYNDEIINVTWTCGSGAWGHDDFVRNSLVRIVTGRGEPLEALSMLYDNEGMAIPSSIDSDYKADSVILNSLIEQYGLHTVTEAFEQLSQSLECVSSEDQISGCYGLFMGKRLFIAQSYLMPLDIQPSSKSTLQRTYYWKVLHPTH